MNINRRDFLRCAGACGAAGFLHGVSSLAEGVIPDRPGRTSFFSWWMTWAGRTLQNPFTEITALNRRYLTPNMEALADESVKFTQAYASALCSPTRVSLITGWNAARHALPTGPCGEVFPPTRIVR